MSRGDRLIRFVLPTGRYCLYLTQVAEVLEETPTFQIPKGPPYLAEALNFHGEVVPLLDLEAFSRKGNFTLPGKTLVIAWEQGNLAIKAGLDVTIIPAEKFAADGSEAGHPFASELQGTDEALLLLDLGKLMDSIEKDLIGC